MTKFPLLKQTFALLLCMGLASCSFKKGGDEKAVTQPPTATEEKAEAGPKDIFEAVNYPDVNKALDYISRASFDEVNLVKNGFTPLSIAVRKGKIELVDCLLKQGALPFKPNENNTNALTLAKSLNNEAIYNALNEQVLKTQLQSIKLIESGHFEQAQLVLANSFHELSATLQNGFSYLDLVVNNSKLNANEATKVILKLIGKIEITSKSKVLLWSFALNLPSFEILESLMANNVNIEASEISNLYGKQALEGNKIEILRSLNRKKIFLTLNLANEQRAYLEYLSSDTVGKSLSIDQIKKDLWLISVNSNDKEICVACVRDTVTLQIFSPVRSEILATLIQSSNITDQWFLSKTIANFDKKGMSVVLSQLNSELKKKQKGLILSILADQRDSSQNFERAILAKEFGIQLSADESQQTLNILLKASYEGQTQAAELLRILTTDFLANKAALKYSKHDLLLMASKEVTRLFKYSDNNLFPLSLLRKINGATFEGILYKATNSKGKEIELLVDYSYFRSWLISSNPQAGQNNSSLGESFAQYFSLNDFAVAYKQSIIFDVQFSRFEMPLLTTLGPYLEENQLRDIAEVASGLAINFDEPRRLVSYLSIEKKRISSESLQKILRLYIPAIAKMPANIFRRTLLASFVNDLSFNFSSEKGSITSLTTRLIENEIISEIDADILRTYLLKQNPRLFMAIRGDLINYRSFFSGNFGDDPLCSGRFPNSTKILASVRQINPDYEISQEEYGVAKQNCENTMPAVRPKTGNPIKDAENNRTEFADSKTRNDREWIENLVRLNKKIGPDFFDKLNLFGMTAKVLESKFEPLLSGPAFQFLGSGE